MTLWQVMCAGWTAHKEKLQLMEFLCCKMEDVLSSSALSELRGAVCTISDDLQCLQRKYHEIVEHLNSHRQSITVDSHKQTSAADVDNMNRNAGSRFAIIATYSI